MTLHDCVTLPRRSRLRAKSNLRLRGRTHGGTVTFTAYDSKGRETERATFPSSFQSATTRPALSNASKVTSTTWHTSFNLPTTVAEPHKITTRSYNAKGMLTGQSWTATTDATGAAKFTALKTGSTYATGWGYNANSLATSIVTRETAAGATVAVETGRWTQTVNASGDVTRVTNVTDNSIAGRATEHDVHGQLLAARTPSGGQILLKYNLRHQLSEYKNEGLTLKFQWTAFGALQRIDGPGTDVVIYEYDSAQRLVGVRKQLTYASLDESALRQFARTLRRLVELPIGTAHAQVVLPPLIPVPPFTPVPRPRTPIPTDPGEVLMPSQPPPDANRDLARRLGDSIHSVIDRLLCTPECKLLQAEIDGWTGAVRKRYLDMVVDKSKLFCTRPEGKNSWKGHQDKYRGDQTTLRNLIARARAINCPYNPEADDWAHRQAPICPG
jgi:hypothetical protein